MSKLSEEKIEKTLPSPSLGGFGMSTKPSSAVKRPLAGVTTFFYVGTEVRAISLCVGARDAST